MKKAVLLFVAVAAFSAATGSSIARQNNASERQNRCERAVNPQAVPDELKALLGKYPKGSEDLRAAIAGLLIRDPAQALTIVALSKLANADQRTAIAAGYADALNKFPAQSKEASLLKAALPCDLAFASLVNTALASLAATTGGRIGGATMGFAPISGFTSGPQPTQPNVSPN